MPQRIENFSRLPLTNDYIFKRIFAHEGNEDILKDLLEAILNIQIQSINVQNPELLKNNKEEKRGILDIKVELNNNTIIDVEMQVKNQNNIDSRSTTYLSKLVANQLHIADQYERLKKSIVICILNFNYYKRNSYHNIARMKFEETTKKAQVDMGYIEEDKIASEYLEMHFIELPKFIKKNPEASTKLEQWLWLLSGKEEKIKMAEKENKEIKKAVKILDEISMDPKERERYESIFMAEYFQRESELNFFEKGKLEGELKRNIEIAKKLLSKNMSIPEITEITGLSENEINNIDSISLPKEKPSIVLLQEFLQQTGDPDFLKRRMQYNVLEEKVKIIKEFLSINLSMDEIIELTGLTKDEIENLMKN